jgi:hypothetical protein
MHFNREYYVCVCVCNSWVVILSYLTEYLHVLCVPSMTLATDGGCYDCL